MAGKVMPGLILNSEKKYEMELLFLPE